jgi:hypothetical protein
MRGTSPERSRFCKAVSLRYGVAAATQTSLSNLLDWNHLPVGSAPGVLVRVVAVLSNFFCIRPSKKRGRC